MIKKENTKSIWQTKNELKVDLKHKQTYYYVYRIDNLFHSLVSVSSRNLKCLAVSNNFFKALLMLFTRFQKYKKRFNSLDCRAISKWFQGLWARLIRNTFGIQLIMPIHAWFSLSLSDYGPIYWGFDWFQRHFTALFVKQYIEVLWKLTILCCMDSLSLMYVHMSISKITSIELTNSWPKIEIIKLRKLKDW